MALVPLNNWCKCFTIKKECVCNYNEEMVLKTILKRRSTRKFNSKEISQKDLDDLIQAGIYAPSGSNSQNQRFLLLTDQKEIFNLTTNRDRSCDQKRLGWMYQATALVVVFTDIKLNPQQDLWKFLNIQNASASIENILILATAKKIGSCWISFVDEMDNTPYAKKPWRQILSDYDIPQSYKPYGMILLGYTDDVDEDGYPVGEDKHGIHKLVKRDNVESYLIKRK